ncbi:hypothetical protein [Tellurirhabdus rosea]|uniref:hypothetical protein n=1 Tax=Tellurirhabdus rosea TaxID=2674997 RepID=UPI0022561153|nr:hypothetical protein [Tellurirhabdus rosea]
MKQYTLLFLTILLLGVVAGCKKTEVDSDPKSLLVANSWKLNRITDVQGQTIANSRLGIETQAIFGLDIQFRENNVTRATDRVTKQIINGGTWFLTEDAKAIDIEISQFKGRFELVELSRGKLVLRNRVPVSGTQQDANMEFVPSL